MYTIKYITQKIVSSPWNKVNKDKLNKVQEKIITIICDETITLEKKLVYIDVFLTPYKKPLPQNRQDFICKKIIQHFEKNKVQINSTNKIIDIGGGNGNVLKYIGQYYCIPKKNLFCIEKNINDNINTNFHSFSYNFSNTNYITYQEDLDLLEDLSVDIIFVMVSLHHMNDETINDTLKNTNRVLKKGGLFIVKEHDATSRNIIVGINWEHHLYHLMGTSKTQTLADIQDYLKHFVNNYKKLEEWNSLFKSLNFELKNTFNNVFDPSICHKNSSQLYWQIWQK
jgi:ubiquinone/menaquinone biosynthesis C-methylase UbiE